MQVLDWTEFAAHGLGESAVKETAMTIGVFDGIHLGHQALLERVLASGLYPVVVSFIRSPKFVLRPETAEGEIMGVEQKLRLFEQMGVGLTVMIDFSEQFSKLGGKEFIDLLHDRGSLRYLVIGSNFRCGFRHSTDAALIREMNRAAGIPTEVAAPVMAGGERISSSRIRTAISAGSLATAQAFLGRRVEIDFAGLSATPGSGGVCFDLAAKNRIMPPEGRYPVLLFEKDSFEGIETEVSITRDGVFVPSNFNAVSIEFLSGSNRSVNKWL
jgi:riboflavin kinase/FMN adenylyltransferase